MLALSSRREGELLLTSSTAETFEGAWRSRSRGGVEIGVHAHWQDAATKIRQNICSSSGCSLSNMLLFLFCFCSGFPADLALAPVLALLVPALVLDFASAHLAAAYAAPVASPASASIFAYALDLVPAPALLFTILFAIDIVHALLALDLTFDLVLDFTSDQAHALDPHLALALVSALDLAFAFLLLFLLFLILLLLLFLFFLLNLI